VVQLWDVETGRAKATLSGHGGRVLALAFSQGGLRLASAGDDQTIKLWDPSTGREERTLTGHTAAVYFLGFANDGRLVSASLDGTMRWWNTHSGQVEFNQTIECWGPAPLGNAVDVKPEHRLWVATSEAACIKQWDIPALRNARTQPPVRPRRLGMEDFQAFRREGVLWWALRVPPDVCAAEEFTENSRHPYK
jgi:WD40 repeat protein